MAVSTFSQQKCYMKLLYTSTLILYKTIKKHAVNKFNQSFITFQLSIMKVHARWTLLDSFENLLSFSNSHWLNLHFYVSLLIRLIILSTDSNKQHTYMYYQKPEIIQTVVLVLNQYCDSHRIVL